MSYNFIIGPTDTDSLSFCKPDMSPFSNEELINLLKEINDISPEFIEWENDGYYECCIALKAKNYVLWDGKKKTVKGSAFKTSSKERALAEFMNKVVDALIFDKQDQLVNIYHEYIKEALNVQDIKRWAQKKTLTESILKCKDWTEEQILSKELRKNECDVWDAIKDEEAPQQGDKYYVYPLILGKKIIPGGVSEKTGKPLKDKVKEINGLRLTKHWKNDHDSEKLIERVYDTLKIFSSIIDMNQFIDYSKQVNKPLLMDIK